MLIEHSYGLPSDKLNTPVADSVLIDHSYSLPSSKLRCDPVSVLFWNIDGRNRFFDVLQEDFLDSYDVIFLSETWLLDPSPSHKVQRKNYCSSPAVRTAGRPSGGIEFYSSPQLKAKSPPISSSNHHLCIKLKDFICIGVYFKPTVELDEIVSDLYDALHKCQDQFPDCPIVLGGDFNLHSGTEDFNELEEFLNCFDISLCSNPLAPTFISNQGVSTPDHVFCSRSIYAGLTCSVSNRIESDHLPLTVQTLIPLYELERREKKVLNVDRCNALLGAALPLPSCNSSSNTSSTTLPDPIEVLNSILSDALDEPQPRNSPQPPWSSHRLEELRNQSKKALQLYLRHRTAFYRTNYCESRKQFQSENRKCKHRHKEKQVAEVINAARSEGISALYKPAKRYARSSSSQIPLHDWVNFCETLYQTHDEPELSPVASVPSQAASDLTNPFTLGEIHAAIQHQSSKAKSLNHISPADLKKIITPLAEFLLPIFNDILSLKIEFPDSWLNSVFFFLHKKGALTNPANYRSIAIEDSLLKLYMTLLTQRLTLFAESQNLLPEFQFGFRKKRSTTATAMILKHAIKQQMELRNKTYTCFVDFKKAFDLIDRSILFQKLQNLGIPPSLCKLLHSILSRLQCFVRSNDSVSSSFSTYNGVPQGDPLSPLLFSLFIADLPDHLTHQGIELAANVPLRYLLYADDLVITASSPGELQTAINDLSTYCLLNNLTVSIEKSKCMTFHRGYHRPLTYLYNNHPLENVNAFTYLGSVFTTQLAATKHINHIISKCNSRIGYLFSALPLTSTPLPIAISVFNIYILPIITYNITVWLPELCPSSAKKLNSVFTKFLKRYLGLPYATHNSLVYHITNTLPLTRQLDELHPKRFMKLTFPQSLEHVQLTPPSPIPALLHPDLSLPDFFALSQTVLPPTLPVLPAPRRALLYDSLDLLHPHICLRNDFHNDRSEACVCRFCLRVARFYHRHVCPALFFLTPCATLKKVHQVS